MAALNFQVNKDASNALNTIVRCSQSRLEYIPSTRLRGTWSNISGAVSLYSKPRVGQGV